MTTSSTSADVNPFVGPRPLETGQRIFGRDREIEELYYLLSAERIVLLHSPSGAGKSSLIRAGLVPRLAERFDVRGPTRLNTQPPEGTPVNRYVRSANLGFEQGLPEERRRADDLISRMTLAEYVEGRPRRRSAPQNVVLIFDQFEEILTADPLAFDAKREFFRQLGELLQDPRVWVLFALREDYLAPLDPYADQIPTHLKNRFRVDLLSREASQEAMVGTAAEGGRAFAQDAVEKLVMDLATIKVQQPDGSFESQVGPHVEPLHLQVACRGLWERMPPTDLSIDLEHLKSFGDVTRALARYYADVVGAKPGVERAIREWVDEKLITKDGIRSQALRGVGTSEGLSNELIAGLVDKLLVRAEQRGGATWYELAHDRLVEPVRTSNVEWFKEKLHPMQRQARLWKQEDEPDRLLLRDRDLKEAESWARDNAASVLPIEKKLLDSSAKKRRAARTKVAMVAFVICMSGAAGIGGVIALQEGQRAAERRAQADAYFQVHQASLQLAPGGDFRSALRLLESAFTTHPDFTTRSAFLSALAKTPNQLETSFTGLKGDVKQLRFGPDGVLAAVAGGSVRLLDTQNAGASGPSFVPDSKEAPSILCIVRRQDRSWLAQREDGTVITLKPGGNVTQSGGSRNQWDIAAFSRDGQRLAGVNERRQNEIIIAAIDDLRNVAPQRFADEIAALVFGPDDGLAVATEAGEIFLISALGERQPFREPEPAKVQCMAWRDQGEPLLAVGDEEGGIAILKRGSTPRKLPKVPGGIQSLAWSPDGQSLAAACSDGTVRIWAISDARDAEPQALGVFSGHKGPVLSVAWSTDGSRLASGGNDGTVCIWRPSVAFGPVITYDRGVPLHSLAVSGDGTRIAAGSEYGDIFAWDTGNANQVTIWHTGTRSRVLALAWQDGQARLASGSESGDIYVWQRTTRDPIRILETGGVEAANDQAVWRLRWSSHGNQLASSSHTGAVQVWEPDAGVGPRLIGKMPDSALGLAWSPDDATLSVGSTHGEIWLWNAAGGAEPVLKIPREVSQGHRDSVSSLAFLPGGKILASCGRDGTLRLWDARSGNATARTLPVGCLLNDLAPSEDSSKIAAAGADGDLRVWESDGLVPSLAVELHQRPVSSVVWNGSRIFSASEDGTVRVLELDETKWRSRARQLVGVAVPEPAERHPNENYKN